MQTIKTAVVVVLLLFVLYGGYCALNGTDAKLSDELDKLVKFEDIPDVSGPTNPMNNGLGSASSNGFASFNNTPAPNFSAPKFDAPNSLPVSTSNATAANGFPSLPSSPSTLPSSNSGLPLQPSPLLTPSSTASSLPSSLPSTTSSLPPFPSNNSSASSKELANEASNEDAKFVSTNSSPGFGLAIPSSNQPNDSSKKDFPDSPSIPSLELADSGNDIADATQPDSTSLADADPSQQKLSSKASRSYENAKETAMEQINRSQLKDALATLSIFYNAPELSSEQRQDLLDLLDALAREVVFSRRHLLDLPYVVAPGEKIEQIANRYEIPPELLAKINAYEITSQLPAGAKLKVVPGPFRAEVDLNRSELTVFVGDLYAARFPVSLGSEPTPTPGVFQVVDKQRNRNYYGSGGINIPASDPRNPYGGWWIDLGQEVCIHGTSDVAAGPNRLGCISLAPQDVSDVFGMLKRGSQVTVRR